MERIKHHATLSVIICSLVVISFYTYLFRADIFRKFDAQYLNDYYDHSQWTVPQSIRVMGDDARYEVSAYRTLQNRPIYSVAPEVPMLAKYILGVSIKLWENAHLAIIISLFFSLLLTYFLAKQILSPKYALLASLTFSLTPPFITNFTSTTIDSIQLPFALLHIWAIWKLANSTSKLKIFACIAGISAGLFISTKFGLFLLPLLIADVLILKKNKKTKYLIPLLIIIPIIYCLSTIQFFIQNGTISQWAQTHKWIANFYLQSNTGFTPFMIVVTLLTGLYKGWWNEGWTVTPDWTVLYPVAIVAMALIYTQRKKIESNDKINYIFAYLTASVAMYSLIAFWPRYLLLLTPFFILILLYAFEKLTIQHRKYIVAAAIFLVALQLTITTYPSPSKTVAVFKKNMVSKTYQELYEVLSNSDKDKYSRDQFWRENLKFNNLLRAENQSIIIKNTPFVFPWENKAVVPIETTYTSPYGTIKNQSNLKLEKESGKWYIIWDWDARYKKYNPTIEYAKQETLPQTGGILKNNSGKNIMEWKDVYSIQAMPSKVSAEHSIIQKIKQETQTKGYLYHKRLLENTPYNHYIEIDVLPSDSHLITEIQATDGFKTIPDKRTLLVTKEYDPETAQSLKDRYETKIRPTIGVIIKNGDTILLQTEPANGKEVII